MPTGPTTMDLNSSHSCGRVSKSTNFSPQMKTTWWPSIAMEAKEEREHWHAATWCIVGSQIQLRMQSFTMGGRDSITDLGSLSHANFVMYFISKRYFRRELQCHEDCFWRRWRSGICQPSKLIFECRRRSSAITTTQGCTIRIQMTRLQRSSKEKQQSSISQSHSQYHSMVMSKYIFSTFQQKERATSCSADSASTQPSCTRRQGCKA